MALKYYSDVEELSEDIATEDSIELSNSKHLGITKKDIKRWIEYIMKEENETSP